MPAARTILVSGSAARVSAMLPSARMASMMTPVTPPLAGSGD
jgi:hypothetical protein